MTKIAAAKTAATVIAGVTAPVAIMGGISQAGRIGNELYDEQTDAEKATEAELFPTETDE